CRGCVWTSCQPWPVRRCRARRCRQLRYCRDGLLLRGWHRHRGRGREPRQAALLRVSWGIPPWVERRTYARPPNDAVKPGTGLRSHRDHPRCGMFRNPARPSGHALTSSELYLDLSARWPADGWTDPWPRPARTSELPLPAGRNARLPGVGGHGPGPWRRAGSTRAAQRLFPRTGGAGFPRTDDRGAPDRATWLRPARRPPHPADAPRLRPRWRAGRFPARHGAHARARARPCPRPVLMARPAAL